MNYVRSTTLNHSLSSDGQPLDHVTLMIHRQSLIEQFNAAIGAPGAVIEEMQKDFVQGKMPFEEMVSYVRFCEYMIDAVQKRSK